METLPLLKNQNPPLVPSKERTAAMVTQGGEYLTEQVNAAKKLKEKQRILDHRKLETKLKKLSSCTSNSCCVRLLRVQLWILPPREVIVFIYTSFLTSISSFLSPSTSSSFFPSSSASPLLPPTPSPFLSLSLTCKGK